MDNTSLMSFLDIIVVLAGVYVLYSWYLLVTKKEIRQGVMIPKDVDPRRCKDIDGFVKYMSPRTLVLGIMALISGGIGIYQDNIRLLNPIIYWTFFVAFLGVLIWFGYGTKKALKDYF